MYIGQLNRFLMASISIIACDKEFRVMPRLISAELGDIRFRSDGNLYYTFRWAELIRIICTLPVQ